MLSAEDTLVIKEIVKEALEVDRATWREKRAKEAAETPKPEKEKERKLMLITTSQGTEVGFPDERGRVILNRSFYGWVTRTLPRKDDWDQTVRVEAIIEVVSFQDNRPLEKPIPMTLLHWTSMVEVEESILEKPLSAGAA